MNQEVPVSVNGLIEHARTLMKELEITMLRLTGIMGVPMAEGETLYEGEHMRLIRERTGEEEQLPVLAEPPPNGRAGWGNGKTKMKPAKDPKKWPFESGKPTSPMTVALQKILKSKLGRSGKDRYEIKELVRSELKPKLKREEAANGRPLWEVSLQSLLRNYSRAGYIIKDGRQFKLPS